MINETKQIPIIIFRIFSQVSYINYEQPTLDDIDNHFRDKSLRHEELKKYFSYLSITCFINEDQSYYLITKIHRIVEI